MRTNREFQIGMKVPNMEIGFLPSILRGDYEERASRTRVREIRKDLAA
jgi:hypothetical protein